MRFLVCTNLMRHIDGMTRKHWKDWHLALLELIEQQDDDDVPLDGERLVAAISRLVDVDASGIFFYGLGEPPTVVFDDFEKPWRRSKVTDYVAGAYLLDPFFQLAQNGAAGLFRLSDFAAPNFYRSAYFLSYYREGRVGDEVNVLLPLEGGVLALSLERKGDGSPFSEAELARLEAVSPIIEHLLRRSWKVSDQRGSMADRRAAHQALQSALACFGISLLTQREQEILQLLFQGYSTLAIAERLGIASGTVKVHRKRIYTKLDIKSQSELLPLLVGALSCLNAKGSTDPLADYLNPPAPLCRAL